MSRYAIFSFAGLAVFGLASCSGPSIKILDRPVNATATTRAFTSSTALEKGNRETLRDENLLKLYNRDRQAAIEALAARFKKAPTREIQLALAEMSSDYADILTEKEPLAAIGRYLDTAWLTRKSAAAAVLQGVSSPERIMNSYASARIVRLIGQHHETRRKFAVAPGTLQNWNVALASGKGEVDPRDFDLVVPSSWLKTDGIKWKSIRREGYGVAMVGQQKATQERLAADPQMPVAGRGYPLNARVDFDGRQAMVVLQDLMVESTVDIDGKTLPLHANFSTAVAFSYHDKVRRMNKFEALLRPAEYDDTMGLFSFRPYDPERIPLVLVHGLMSSAEAWYPFINLLLADEVVRERYQILVFNYPSGVPISRSAHELRVALAAYQKRNDPVRNNPQMRRMVILGHSMGGIISNAEVRSSGDRVYRAVFTKNLNELDLTEEERKEVERFAYFEANPDIARAILLAAPLRGSAFASNRIGQFGASLIRLPFDIVDSVFGQIEVIDALTDVAQQASQRPQNSVTSLRPDNPLLGALLSCPVRPGVEIHSIMGQSDPDLPKEEGSDGFVPYTSSRLDEAVSELVVMKTDHRGMVNRDETVREVWRILHLHLKRD